jgi:hypothetical protein
MFRELAQILLSIQLSTHAIPQVREEALAKHIQKRAMYVDVDPFLVVAIITHESLWQEDAISKDGLDYGLMQIRSIYYGDNPRYLLQGENNITVGTGLIKLSINYCRNRLHREPATQEWLAIYQGSGFDCHPTKLTKQFEDYALCLQDDVENNKDRDCKEIYKAVK